MYGLYRAWFGGGATGTGYPCLQDTFSPPDTVVRVGNEGEHQFVAHKGVLAAHSGYLKALLASAATTTTTSATSSSSSSANSPFDPTCATVAVTATNGQSQRPVTSVSVSSIGGEAFAPLLNYMYTGRLEVTLDNVYSVLLATHLLHMPGALEQCRAALLRLRAPTAPVVPMPPVPTSTSTTTGASPGIAGSILRPIPSRLVVGPPLCWPPTTPLAYSPTAPAPTAMSHLPPSMQPLIQSTLPPSIGIVAPREKQAQCVHYSAGEASKSPKSSPISSHKRPKLSTSRSRTPEIVSTLPFVAAAAAAFTAFAVTSGTTTNHPTTRASSSSPSRSISPALSSVSRNHSPVQRNNDRSITEREAQREEREIRISTGSSTNDQQRKSCITASADNQAPSRNHDNDNNNDDNNGDDIGAISEHDRAHSSRRRARSTSAKEITSSSSSSSSTILSVVYDIACCDGPVRFHRVLNENYLSTTAHGHVAQTTRPPRINCQLTEGEDLSSENDENGRPTTRIGNHARSPSVDSSNDGSNSNNGGCYTCGYCKHTFKSQYCYRKHAKRHLLPTRINETISDGGGNNVNHEPTITQDAARSNRREVRLLDLNVQYYPCKICGCKFPSYYFVHKHRKLCHANDDERQGDADGASVVATNMSSRDCRDADASSIREAP